MGTAAQSPAPGGERLLSLDVLRGLAVLLVLESHMGPQVYRWGGRCAGSRPAGTGEDGSASICSSCSAASWYPGSCSPSTASGAGCQCPRFYVRRGFKIYPAFFCLVVFKALYLVLVARRPPGLRPFLVEACFLQSCLPGFVGIYTWSLAVEEHFYLVLPWLLLLARRDRGQADPFRPLVGIVAGAAGLCLTLRVLAASRHGFDLYRNIFPTHLRIDSLLVGPLNPGVALVLYVAGSVAFGALMAHVVEYPVLRARNRWFPSRTGPPLRAPSPASPVPEAPVSALPVLKGVETA